MIAERCDEHPLEQVFATAVCAAYLHFSKGGLACANSYHLGLRSTPAPASVFQLQSPASAINSCSKFQL